MLRLCLLALSLFAATSASAEPVMSYSGRLTDGQGKPLAGPIDVELRFFDDDTAGAQRGATIYYAGLTLADGLFQVDVDVSASEADTIFGDGSSALFVEVSAAGKSYPRQRILRVPYALRIPIDPAKLAFENGRLTVKTDSLGDVNLGAEATLGLGTYDNAQETTLLGSGLTKGATWFNSDINQIRYWNGTTASTVGAAGSGLTSLGGLGALNQFLAVDHVGTALSWNSATATHTLHIPLASAGAGVTGGLISNGEYAAFTNKVDRAGDTIAALEVTNALTVDGMTAPAGVVGKGRIFFDAGSNRFMVTENNGTAVRLVPQALDAASTPTFASVHVGAGTQALPSVTSINDAGGDTGLFWPGTPAGNNLAITTAGTEKIRVDANGFVGLATTNPITDLHVANGSPGADATYHGNVVIESKQTLNAKNGLEFKASNGGNGYGYRMATVYDGAADINMYFQYRSNNANWTSTPLVIKGANGSVGIGSIDPQAKLDVAGTVAATGFKLSTSPTSGHVLTSDGSGTGTWQAPAAASWATPGAIGATTPSTGAFTGVSIGTTAAGTDLFFGSGGNRAISVQNQATAGNSLTVQAGGTTGSNLNGGDLVLSSGTANGTGSSKIEFKTANGGAPVTSMTLLGNGNLGLGTTTPGTTVPPGGTAPQALEIKKDSTGDSALFLRRSDNLVGLDLWSDNDFGVAMLDSRHDTAANSGGFRFRTRTNGTPVDAMAIDGAGKVGIGTTSPSELLHLNGGTSSRLRLDRINTGGESQIFFRNASGDAIFEVGLNDDATNSFHFRDGDANVNVFTVKDGATANSLVVHTGGNVGVGTATPAQKLSVSGGHVLIDNNQAYRGKTSGGTEVELAKVSAGDQVLIGQTSGTTHTTILSGTGNVAFSPGGTDRVTVYPTGSSLAAQVHSGYLRVDSGGAAGMPAYSIGTNGHGNGMFSPAVDNIAFATNDAESVRIDSTGSVGIGTTNPSGARLQILQVDGQDHLQLKNPTAVTGKNWSFASENTGQFSILDRTNSIRRLVIDTSDQVVAYGNIVADHASVYATGNASAQFVLNKFDAPAKAWNIINNGKFNIHENAVGDRLTVDTDGDVGIGTTDPQARLHVDGTDLSGLIVEGESNKRLTIIGGTDDHPTLGPTVWGSRIIGDVGQNVFLEVAGNSSDDRFSVVTDPSNGGTPDTEVFTVTNAGSVGIGSTSPAAKLDVQGDVRIGNSLATCNGTVEGSQRYNATSKRMEFCNGTSWMAIGQSSGSTYCGKTASTYNGSTVGGWTGAKAKCVTACGTSTAHMCAWVELERYFQEGGSHPGEYLWVGVTETVNNNTQACMGFTTTSGWGAALHSSGQYPYDVGCNSTYKIACCD